jgi:hypothetical protein
MARYWRRAAAFEPGYVHLSSNPRDFELRCIQRWFAILELAREQGWERLVHLDSDVLVFSGLDRLAAAFGDAQLTLHGRSPAPHVLFVLDVEALESFVAFVEAQYSEPEQLEELRDFYRESFLDTGAAGGVCDMTLWNRFRAQGRARAYDTSAVFEGGTIDNNLNEPEGYRMELGLKRIEWREGAPHGVREDGTLVRFHALHLQGRAKSCARLFRSGRPLSRPRVALHRWGYRIERALFRLRRKASG